MTDQFDNGLVARQGFSTPVFGDETEQPMLDLIPLAGPWRKVTYMQRKSEFIGQLLKRNFPKPIATAVATTVVGGT